MKLQKEKIEQHLKKDAFVSVYATTGSTNDLAVRFAANDDRRLIVAADEQTAGKGRQGKSFYSPAESGVYFSVVLKPRASALTGITCASAVAAARAIKKVTGIETQIKWVNDIYYNNRKVCGILAQAVSIGEKINKVVIGIGINLFTENFPKEISGSAGSLGISNIDKNLLVAEVSNEIMALEDASFALYRDEYKKRSCVLGREIFYIENNRKYFALAEDIDSDGGLIVSANGKKKTLTSGEITLRLRNNL